MYLQQWCPFPYTGKCGAMLQRCNTQRNAMKGVEIPLKHDSHFMGVCNTGTGTMPVQEPLRCLGLLSAQGLPMTCNLQLCLHTRLSPSTKQMWHARKQ